MSYKYEHLMSPLKIGSITVRNRYAVGPMGGRFYQYGTKGEFSPNGINYFIERAKGGFGLIVTGSNPANQTVDPFDEVNGNPGPSKNTAYFGYSSRTLVEGVHAFGGRIFLQISMGHGRMREGKTPSPTPYFKHPQDLTTELTREEIQTKVADMIKLAKLAKGWGYDGVEIHGMHWGYLLDQFAMAYTNHRTDEYGGDLDGRLRVHREIITGIKEACGKDFPVSIRMCMKTYMTGFNQSTLTGEGEVGRTIEETVEIAKRFEKYGVDMLNLNSGTYDSFYYCVSPYYMPKGYNIHLARQVKKAVSIPVFVAGGMDDPDMCEKAIADGDIDGVTMARASLADAHYVRKVAEGRLDEIRPCIKCTNCIHYDLANGVVQCSANPSTMRELTYGIPKAEIRKKVAVVGGGVAGMEAARTAQLAGHEVVLYEAAETLGGHLIEAGSHPFKSGIAALRDWYIGEMKRLGITVKLNTAMTAEDIKNSGAQAVVLAVGSDHFVPHIPGYDHEKASVCYDVLMDKVPLGKRVVVVGGGLTGAELAYDLASYQNKEVVLVEALDNILSAGMEVPTAVKTMLTKLLDYKNVDIRTGNKIAEVNDCGAVIENKDGIRETVPADNVVFAIGLRPKKSMAQELLGTGIEVYEVGDGTGVGNIRTATAAAYEVARRL